MCTRLPATIEAAKEKFALACQEATTLEIVGNVAAAFNAVGVVTLLREELTEEVMDKVFMPLMNTKIGFMTDRTGKPDKRGNVKPLYSRDVVRDCIIDAVIIGLLPTGRTKAKTHSTRSLHARLVFHTTARKTPLRLTCR